MGEISKSDFTQIMRQFKGPSKEKRQPIKPEYKAITEQFNEVLQSAQKPQTVFKNLSAKILKDPSLKNISPDKIRDLLAQSLSSPSPPPALSSQSAPAKITQNFPDYRAQFDKRPTKPRELTPQDRIKTELNAIKTSNMMNPTEQQAAIEKLKEFLPKLSEQDFKAAIDIPQFWAIFDQVPKAFAEILSPEQLGILAAETKFHATLIPKLIDQLQGTDSKLDEKLLCIAKHGTIAIEKPLKIKSEQASSKQKQEEIILTYEKATAGRTVEEVQKKYNNLKEGSLLNEEQIKQLRSLPERLEKAQSKEDLKALKSIALTLYSHMEKISGKSKPPLSSSVPAPQKKPWATDTVPAPKVETTPVRKWPEEEIQTFITQTLKPAKALEALESLNSMDTESLKILTKNLFVKGGSPTPLENFWSVESKPAGGESNIELRRARLAVVLQELSQEQLEASVNDNKFHQILQDGQNGYLQTAAQALSRDQLNIIGSQNVNKEMIPTKIATLTAIAYKIPPEDTDLKDKLTILKSFISRQEGDTILSLNARKKLREAIEFRSTLRGKE